MTPFPAGSHAEKVYLHLRDAVRPLVIQDLAETPFERIQVSGLLARHPARNGGFARSDTLHTLVGGTRPSGQSVPLQSAILELLCRRPHTRREIVEATGASDRDVQIAVILLRKRGPIIETTRCWTFNSPQPCHSPTA